MSSEFDFKNPFELNGYLVSGVEFRARPSFLKDVDSPFRSIGFNIRDKNKQEYRGFLNGVGEEDFRLDNEFDLVVKNIKQREEDRSIVQLKHALLHIGDVIYCEVGNYSEKYGTFESRFKNHYVNLSSRSDKKIPIGDWRYALAEISKIRGMHDYYMALPLLSIEKEEYEDKREKIFRPIKI